MWELLYVINEQGYICIISVHPEWFISMYYIELQWGVDMLIFGKYLIDIVICI